MNFILQAWQLFLMVLASWVNREQQKIIEFYQAELKAVMDAQGKKRLLLTDDHRRLLAVKGESLVAFKQELTKTFDVVRVFSPHGT